MQQASKLTMMATMTTVATGDNDDGATDDGGMGYKDDDDCDGQRQQWRQAMMAMAMAMAMVMALVDDNNDVNGDGTTGNKVGNDGNSAMGNNNNNDDTTCEATTNCRRLLWVATACFIVFNVSPSEESSHLFICCAVSAMIYQRVGLDVRIDSSPETTVQCTHLSPPATTEIYRSQFQFHSEAGVKHIG